MKTFILAAAAFAVTVSANAVSAATIFSGHTGGYFATEDGTKGTHIVNSGHGADTKVIWGSTPHWDHDTDPHVSDTSSLTIKTFHFGKTLQTGHNKIKVGALKWFNASSTHVDTNFNASAWLKFDLDQPMDWSYNWDKVWFNIKSTSNSSNPSSDLVIGTSFDDYWLNLPVVISDRTTLTAFSYEANGGSLHGSHWRNAENSHSYLNIYAHVDVAPVPLPAAGWMLLAGVGGLFAAKRRKKA